MRAEDFYLVEPLLQRREILLRQRDQGRIEISIDGIHQNRVFVDVVTPAIKLALRYEIEDIECQLRGFGVTTNA